MDAGYRWAYWLLEEPGIVRCDEVVDVERVLAATLYWNPNEEDTNEWLCDEILPAARQFLDAHREHGIVYVDHDRIIAEESLWYNWREIGRGPSL